MAEVQVAHHGKFIGSSHGWLIFVNWETASISAINPFTGIRKDIAPMFIVDFVVKAVLSHSPDSSSYAIMMIIGTNHDLAMLKSSNSTWTFNKQWFFQDVIIFKRKFLALEAWRRVFAFDEDGNDLSVIEQFAPLVDLFSLPKFFKNYIVETKEGELLQVMRIFQDYLDESELYWTVSFSVFKWVDEEGDSMPRWDRVETLREYAIFLGDNHSLSVSAMDFLGCQSNLIYYTDDGSGCPFSTAEYWDRGAHDFGVYNMETRTILQHYVPNESERFLPPPIWIIPTLKKHGN